ncbi:sensor histidine kinase [Litoribacter populi]|uniref:sensor histidine kinase n=1 Tax=Litoribacter populi TaxID=2598460 RepID=UPI00117FA911|nr:histidine kinase [Litoribacter populi]
MPVESPLKKKIAILIHILGWFLFGSYLFIITPLSWKADLPLEFWAKQSLMLGLLLGAFYFNLFYLVPRILFKNKTFLFLIIALAMGGIYTGLLIAYDISFNMQEIMHNIFRPDTTFVPRPRSFSNYDFYNLMVFYMGIGISTSVGAVRKWQKDEALRLEMNRQQVDSELTYLKAQINPHFFFNTLNNIYSLTNLDIQKAQTAILKLSRMMRYVLYETEKDSTMLSKELDFIKDYIELMRLRLSDKVQVNIEIPQQFEDARLAPMLLLPFLENSFKHGVSSQRPSAISVKICVKDKMLKMEAVNTIFQSNQNTPEGSASGIGLANTKRRLSLLYGQKHELKIDDQNPENEYRVDLKINLS